LGYFDFLVKPTLGAGWVIFFRNVCSVISPGGTSTLFLLQALIKDSFCPIISDNMNERESRYYPPEVRNLMALREGVIEAVSNILKRNQGLVYYHSGGNEYTATISPQKEELTDVVSPVSAWASYPLKLDITRFPLRSLLAEETSRIDIDLSSGIHPGLRAKAVEEDGTVKLGLNQRKILGESLVVLTKGFLPGEVLGGARFPTPTAIESLGLGAIYPTELSPEIFERARDALEELRKQRPVFFGIVASDLAHKTTHELFLQISQVSPGTHRVEMPATQLFYFKLLLDTLTPSELGIYAKQLIPLLPPELFKEKQRQLREEIEFMERCQRTERFWTGFSISRTTLAAGLGANLFAQRLTDVPVSVAFLSACNAVLFPACRHFGKFLYEHSLKLILAKRAQKKFGEEQRRRFRSLNIQD
jgi:hypothetical protein